MNKCIDFYFDFVSPYSYLAHTRIKKIELQKKIKINYKPILLGGLHKLAKITAPAFVDSKKNYLVQDCEMVAKKFGINFKFNDNFPISSLNFMRGLLTINEEIKEKYINTLFESYWVLNLDISDEKEMNKILLSLNINQDIFFKKINEKKVKDLLKNLTQKAYDKKIFGAPTFVVNKKIFWGQDRLDYALDEYQKKY